MKNPLTQECEVAVVVLVYNNLELIKELLPNWTRSLGADDGFLIANNASNDGTTEWFEMHHPEIPLLSFEENHGFTGGFNRAINGVRAKFVVPLSSDVEVGENWLSPLVDLLKSNQGIAVCQPKIMSRTDEKKFEYAGAAGGYIDTLGIPFCRGRLFDHIETDQGQYDDEREIFWAGGCCFIIRTELFRLSGGFDEDFFAHMEEIDLCWRLQKMGFRITYQPQSKVYHQGGQTLDYNNPRKLYLNYRNNLSMLVKNLSTDQLLWKLPVRFVLDLIGAAYFLFNRGPTSFLAVLNAQASFIFKLAPLWKKRKEVLSLSRSNGAKQIYPNSILLKYFISGKKTFSQLSFDERPHE